MEQREKVSICIPAYENSAGIKRLLDSIEMQTFHDYKVYLTDDSTSNAVEIVCRNYPNVCYARNEKRLGATANWNACLALAQGEYVKIMHHDDFFTDEFSLREFVDMMQDHPEVVLAFSGSRQVESTRQYNRHIDPTDVGLITRDFRNLFLGNTIGAPSAVLVRKSEVAYDEALTWLVDMEYYMALLKEGKKFAYTTKPLISIGISDTQLTERVRDDHELNIFEYGYIYKKYNLSGDEACQKKMLQILVEHGAELEAYESLGFTRADFRRVKAAQFMSKVWWKLTHR